MYYAPYYACPHTRGRINGALGALGYSGSLCHSSSQKQYQKFFHFHFFVVTFAKYHHLSLLFILQSNKQISNMLIDIANKSTNDNYLKTNEYYFPILKPQG